MFSCYLVNDKIGGYYIKMGNVIITGDYIPAHKIVEMAKKRKVKIHLASGFWQRLGRKGYGEKVSPHIAEKLISRE